MTDKENILKAKAYEYATKGSWTHQTHPDKIFYPGTGDIVRYTHYLNGLIDAQEEIERLKTALSTYHGLAVKAERMEGALNEINRRAKYEKSVDMAVGIKVAEMLSSIEVISRTALEDITSEEKPIIPDIGNMEYRGPNSHCKACEDERNGIKHLVAQKHTCRKNKL